MWERSQEDRKAAAEVGDTQETEAKTRKRSGLKDNRSQEQDTA